MIKGLTNFLNHFVGSLSRDIGIDLGTCNTLVYVKNQGIIANEPSVVAFNAKTNKVLLDGKAVGKTAKEMMDYHHDTIKVIRPLKEGEIVNLEATKALLTYMIKASSNGSGAILPRVVIAIPHNTSEVDRKAVIESAVSAGARKAYLIEQPFAAGLGAGFNITLPRGYMIVDIGGGTTTVAVLALGGIVKCEVLKVAGDAFDRAIINYVKDKYNMLIGPQTAERIKIEIGSCMPLEQELQMEVRGLDLNINLPRKITLTSEEVREALDKSIQEILKTIRRCFENISGEISADLAEHGIALCGGGSLIKKLDKRIEAEIGLPVKIARDPALCVINGTGIVVEKLEQFKEILETD